MSDDAALFAFSMRLYELELRAEFLGRTFAEQSVEEQHRMLDAAWGVAESEGQSDE